jgi:hypothetical protein
MKLSNKSIAAVALVISAAGYARAGAITVGVDPSASWIGYMNVSELPANGGGYDFGSGWGTADLDAVFNGPVLTLTPNTSIDRDVPADPYWWAGGAGGAPNKNMDASMYVEDPTLAGNTVTFIGDVLGNSLVSPYTSVAFIKDFAPDYSYYTEVSVPLTAGNFSITLATTAGDNIQYGFETIGPDARLATVSTLGFAQVTAPAVPEPTTASLLGAAALPVLSRRRRA